MYLTSVNERNAPGLARYKKFQKRVVVVAQFYSRTTTAANQNKKKCVSKYAQFAKCCVIICALHSDIHFGAGLGH